MHAKRSEQIELSIPITNQVAVVASGGVVADWQRTIETRLAFAPPREPGSERLARQLSRGLGWAGLAAAYAGAAYLIFG